MATTTSHRPRQSSHMMVTVSTPSAVVTRTTAPPKRSSDADRSSAPQRQRDDGGDAERRDDERHQRGGVARQPAPQADDRLRCRARPGRPGRRPPARRIELARLKANLIGALALDDDAAPRPTPTRLAANRARAASRTPARRAAARRPRSTEWAWPWKVTWADEQRWPRRSRRPAATTAARTAPGSASKSTTTPPQQPRASAVSRPMKDPDGPGRTGARSSAEPAFREQYRFPE